VTDIDPMPLSQADALIERLRKAILTGEIPADGAPIRVAELEAKYGVSQTPIREALRQLEVEALVERKPRRGVWPAAMSLSQLDELYDLRRLIEISVARRAVPLHDEETLEELDADVELLDLIFSTAQRDEFEEVHLRFHKNLLHPGSTGEIERVLAGIWQRTGRYVRLAMTAFHSGPVGQSQHHSLAQLCRKGDADGVAAELERHLNLTQKSIHRWYEAQGVAG
jgi:DNA-binding GntR family transcriptional regulator